MTKLPLLNKRIYLIDANGRSAYKNALLAGGATIFKAEESQAELQKLAMMKNIANIVVLLMPEGVDTLPPPGSFVHALIEVAQKAKIPNLVVLSSTPPEQVPGLVAQAIAENEKGTPR